MSDTTITIIVAIIAAVPGIAALWRGRNKDRAEAETSYQSLYEKSVERIAQLEARMAKLELRIRKSEKILIGAHKLYHQVRMLDATVTPAYKPPDLLENGDAETV
jgi:hypothetical protein